MTWYVLVVVLVVFVGFMAFTGAPYVPTLPSETRRVFAKLYKLSAKDVLVDIGSGDGVVLREASRRGARAVGYEINPLLVAISRWLSRNDRRVRIEMANFWRRKLPDDTTVVYTFGDQRDIDKMYARVVEEATRIGKPLWFISYGFRVAGETPDRVEGAHILYKCGPLRREDGRV